MGSRRRRTAICALRRPCRRHLGHRPWDEFRRRRRQAGAAPRHRQQRLRSGWRQFGRCAHRCHGAERGKGGAGGPWPASAGFRRCAHGERREHQPSAARVRAGARRRHRRLARGPRYHDAGSSSRRIAVDAAASRPSGPSFGSGLTASAGGPGLGSASRSGPSPRGGGSDRGAGNAVASALGHLPPGERCSQPASLSDAASA